MTDAELLAEVEALCRVLGARLAGKRPFVQAAVLAELTATWLAGHHAATSDDTRRLRAAIMAEHNFAIRRLVELADKEAPP